MVRVATELLSTFEQTQAQLIADRDRILRELAALKQETFSLPVARLAALTPRLPRMDQGLRREPQTVWADEFVPDDFPTGPRAG